MHKYSPSSPEDAIILEKEQSKGISIKEAERDIYYGEEAPPLPEGEIIHFKKNAIGSPEGLHKFLLLKQISECHYIFSFSQHFTNKETYYLSFKTEEYEFARVDLNQNERNDLWKTITDLIECASSYPDIKIERIFVASADASYTAKEIESCMAEILNDSNLNYTREELIKNYKGFKIFDLYSEKYNKDFLEIHYNQKSMAKARSRAFQASIKKYLPEWKIIDNGGNDFILEKQ